MNEFVQAAPHMASEYLLYFPTIWENILNIANSNFTAALAGALAGALTAQRIAERGKTKDDLLKELNSVNSAIALSVSCVSLVGALKKQHINRLKKSYDQDLENFEEYKKNQRNKISTEPFTLNADLSTLSKTSPPITIILDIVMNRLSMTGRGVAAAAALADLIENLNTSIASRNDLIDAFRNNQLPEGANLEHLYLGIPYGNNQTNNMYGDTLNSIHLYTDDVIFFSAKLCEDLENHANALNALYRKKLRKHPPKSSSVNFTEARNNGLIPPDDDYEAWLTGFRQDTAITLSWWQRLIAKLLHREY